MENDILEKLRKAMMGEEAMVQPPLDPNTLQAAASNAEAAQINEQAMSPNLMSEQQLVDKQKQQEANKTTMGQLPANVQQEPIVPKELSMQEKLRQNISKYEALVNKPKESDWRDSLPDMLAGAHNIINYGKNTQLPDIKLGSAEKAAALRDSDKESKLNQLQKLQTMYNDYISKDNPDKITAYQQAQLDSAKEDRELKRSIAKGKGEGKQQTEFEKTLAKKQAASFSDSQDVLQNSALSISAVDDALTAQLDYSKRNLTGTGPIATGFGLTKYLSSDTEQLDAKFKAIDLKNMVSTFTGMSKAVDSDAERRAWKSTQASVSNDDATNVKILLGSKSSLLKDKAIAEAKAEYVANNKNSGLTGFTHPILKGEVTSIVSPSGEMILVDKKQIPELKKQGYSSVDDYADILLKKGSSDNYVTLISPDGQEARVRKSEADKYLKKGATIKE